MKELRKELAAYPGVSQEIAVAADPANVTTLCGTHEDLLIPSSSLPAQFLPGLVLLRLFCLRLYPALPRCGPAAARPKALSQIPSQSH